MNSLVLCKMSYYDGPFTLDGAMKSTKLFFYDHITLKPKYEDQ